MPHFISVVIPMYYEETVVTSCYNRLSSVFSTLTEYTYELIFINDGSKDNTLSLLSELAEKDSRVKVISLSRNFGHQAAVSCGLSFVTGEATIIIDADLQDPPEIIPKMLALWEQGYEVVYGKREKREGENIFKLTTAKLFYRLLNHLSDIAIPVDTGDFRLIDQKIVYLLNHLNEHNRFLRGLVSWCGFNQIALPYQRHSRFAGKTKYPLKKMVHFALDAIISFSAKPLRLIMKLGIFAIIIACILFIYYTIYLFSSPSNISLHFAWLMIALTFFSGVQLISIGVLGEYIARMYDESKNRPLYIIEKKINIK